MDSVLNQVEAANQQIKEAEAVKANAREKALEEAKKLIGLFSFAPSELFEGVCTKKTTRPPVEPKYRHKATGVLWTGRGKRPNGFQKDALGAFIEDVEIL